MVENSGEVLPFLAFMLMEGDKKLRVACVARVITTIWLLLFQPVPILGPIKPK